MKAPYLRQLSYGVLAAVAAICFFMGFKVPHDQYKAKQALPRNEKLALFNPHRTRFTCEIEATKVPTIDAQADAWFREARALEDPDTWEEDRDYKKIVQLTRAAAERRHWKAMLNLASLYLEKREPPHGPADALALVEEAMRLGIPAAYDRMGTYYMEGVGVPADATKAFALWQKAAEMGSPQAMAYLGDKLAATWDSPNDGFWANIPVATKMLECALGQGYGPAAYSLFDLQAWPHSADGSSSGLRTASTKALALQTLQQGVRLGCADCANHLRVEFDHPDDLADMLVPHLDKARSERYSVLTDALQWNPDLRLPNLDQILPLPPATLPQWNGDKKALIKAAKGVTPRLPASTLGTASQRDGRAHVDGAYDLHPCGDTTSGGTAPCAGYWGPTAPDGSAQLQAHLASMPPGLYRPGETFDKVYAPASTGAAPVGGLVWQRFVTVRRDPSSVAPVAATGVAREVPLAEPGLSCAVGTPCPVTGVWQPWLASEHPAHAALNQPWRQAWLVAGQHFPTPWHGEQPPFDTAELTWHLMKAGPSSNT
jgi:TPR repeat protein